MYFPVSLFYFALLIFLIKNGAWSKGLHGYISVCPRRAVDFLIGGVSSEWLGESARLHLVNRKIDALCCNFMNTTLPRNMSLGPDVEPAFDCDALENVILFRKNGCDLIQMPFFNSSFAAPNNFTP